MNQTVRSLCLIPTLAIVAAAFPAHAGKPSFDKKPLDVPDEPLTVLSGTEASAFRIRLEVAPEEIEPDPWALRFHWRTADTNCAVTLEPSIVERWGLNRPETSGKEAGRIRLGGGSKKLHPGKEPGLVNQSIYLLKLKVDPDSPPGESLVLQFSRDGAGRGDTCESDLEILMAEFFYDNPGKAPSGREPVSRLTGDMSGSRPGVHGPDPPRYKPRMWLIEAQARARKGKK
jgi:hypothetical protein